MKRTAATTALALALVFSLSILSAGCEGRISQENFQKIENGMTEAEVAEILGEPTEAASLGLGGWTGTTSTWKAESGTIAIQFMNGKVAMKTFTKKEK